MRSQGLVRPGEEGPPNKRMKPDEAPALLVGWPGLARRRPAVFFTPSRLAGYPRCWADVADGPEWRRR